MNAISHPREQESTESYIPINKGQFTLETPEREALFEINRGSDDPEGYIEYRRRWTAYAKEQYVSEYPLHVDIELASICNLKCPMCYTITSQFKEKVNAKLMDYSLYTKIIDEIGGGKVYSIRLSLRGESFLHRRIIDSVRYAKEHGIKEVSTLTNGVRLDEEMFRQIMEAGIDWITISFDGLRETYEKIRAPAKFDRAVEKIRNYQKIKRAAGRVKPVIKIQSVLPAIQHCTDEFYQLFAPIADLISTNPLIDYLQKDDQHKIVYHDNFSCPQVYQRLVIGADGTVMMCANDEENEEPVGDANSQTIHEIWHGPKLQAARHSHKCHNGIKDYRICAKCYLPRKTEPAALKVGTREIVLENYINRSQVIGT